MGTRVYNLCVLSIRSHCIEARTAGGDGLFSPSQHWRLSGTCAIFNSLPPISYSCSVLRFYKSFDEKTQRNSARIVR